MCPSRSRGSRGPGADEPHAIETLQNGVRVRIGREEVMLPAGEHTYTITYETANQLGLLRDHDELYWNVTGTGWDFPIDSITARVTLPAPVAAGDLRLEAFTGTQGATGRDFTAGVGDDGVIVFETTTPQVAGGNMTIVAGWPKGIIDEAAAKGRAASLLRANLFVILLGLGVLASFVYLHLQWIRVGRDPEKGPLSPRLEPPEGLSPGACRYLHKMRHDDTCFAAALFNLAVTGVLAIRADEDGSYEIERLDPDAKPAFPTRRRSRDGSSRTETTPSRSIRRTTRRSAGRSRPRRRRSRTTTATCSARTESRSGSAC
jgi:hypothetical protein